MMNHPGAPTDGRPREGPPAKTENLKFPFLRGRKSIPDRHRITKEPKKIAHAPRWVTGTRSRVHQIVFLHSHRPPGCPQLAHFGKIAQNGPFYTRKVLFSVFFATNCGITFRDGRLLGPSEHKKCCPPKVPRRIFFSPIFRSSCDFWRPKKFKKRVKNSKIRV